MNFIIVLSFYISLKIELGEDIEVLESVDGALLESVDGALLGYYAPVVSYFCEHCVAIGNVRVNKLL